MCTKNTPISSREYSLHINHIATSIAAVLYVADLYSLIISSNPDCLWGGCWLTTTAATSAPQSPTSCVVLCRLMSQIYLHPFLTCKQSYIQHCRITRFRKILHNPQCQSDSSSSSSHCYHLWNSVSITETIFTWRINQKQITDCISAKL